LSVNYYLIFSKLDYISAEQVHLLELIKLKLTKKWLQIYCKFFEKR